MTPQGYVNFLFCDVLVGADGERQLREPSAVAAGHAVITHDAHFGGRAVLRDVDQ